MSLLQNLEKFVLRLLTRQIDLASILKCIPYKRANPNDPKSIDLQLKSRGIFSLIATLLSAHALAQWISLFHYVHTHGLKVQACLQINYLALYTCLFIFCLQQIVDPHPLMDVQNQIQQMQKSFRKSWTKHPILIVILAGTDGFLVVGILITLGLYLLDPSSPMFVVTALFDMEHTSLTGVYGVIQWIFVAVLELTVLFFSLVTTISVSQTYTILYIAMNTWMKGFRGRMKEAKVVKYSNWIFFEKQYRRMHLFSVLANCFWGSIIAPGSAAVVVLGCVGSIFCTFRLHGDVHPLVHAFFATLAVFMIFGALLGVFGQLSKVNRNACDCLNTIVKDGRKLRVLWVGNFDDGDMKYVAKKMRAMRPFGVRTGIFGHITANTQFAMLDQIINYVILLLAL